MALLTQPFHTFPDTLTFESNILLCGILPLQSLAVPFLRLLPLLQMAFSSLCPEVILLRRAPTPLSQTLSAPLSVAHLVLVYMGTCVPQLNCRLSMASPRLTPHSAGHCRGAWGTGFGVAEVAGVAGVTTGSIFPPHLSLRCT